MMNLNEYSHNAKGKYGLRTYRAVFDYGSCGNMEEYFCEAENLEDAVKEIDMLAAKFNSDSFNTDMKIIPRWIDKLHENGARSCCYEYRK